MPPDSPNESQVTHRAITSQLLFTAGHSLTTKGFFYYFVNEFHPSGRMLALLQIAPEAAETLGGLARPLTHQVRTKKWVWASLVVAARLAALLIPLALLLRGAVSEQRSLIYILVCTLLWYGCQGVAFVTYLSWLSDLVPQRHWGKFFARWGIASLVVSIVVPTAAGYLRSGVLQFLPPVWKAWSYALISGIGGLIVMASTLPMLCLPDSLETSRSPQPDSPRRLNIPLLFNAPGYRWFVLHYWWLSFFQGLTQSVLFLFQSQLLKIPVETYYLMNGTMLLIQIPLSIVGGWWSDRNREREVLILGLLAVSPAMGFFWLASPEQRGWIWGAYACWGLFGAVNVCEQSLNLKLAPAGDNTLHLSIVRQWGGAFAALAGLLGGWWLDQLVGGRVTSETPVTAFHTIFLVSWAGRATAPLWLLAINSPAPTPGSGDA